MAAVEKDAAVGNRAAPKLFHRFDPAAGTQLGGHKPRFRLGGIEPTAKPVEGSLAAEPPFAYVGDFGYCLFAGVQLK
jgi:hypothetical protein